VYEAFESVVDLWTHAPEAVVGMTNSSRTVPDVGNPRPTELEIILYDTFMESGTTIRAACNVNRCCRVLEGLEIARYPLCCYGLVPEAGCNMTRDHSVGLVLDENPLESRLEERILIRRSLRDSQQTSLNPLPPMRAGCHPSCLESQPFHARRDSPVNGIQRRGFPTTTIYELLTGIHSS
jgi:hypothetical protein